MVPIAFFLTFCLAWISQQPVAAPFKPGDEFKADIKLELKPRPVDRYTMDFTETVEQRNRKLSGPLPYLVVNITFEKFQTNEVRVRGFDSNGSPVCNKKATDGLVVKLNLGFTDDLKDHVTPHEFNIYTLNDSRKEVARIHLIVQEDGTFLVNNEVRGKF